MKKYLGKSYSFEFPAVLKKDVVVVGGGPAGCVAALSARRNGADTLLIERDSYLGGMITGGLVTSVGGYRLSKDYVKTIPTSNWDTPLMIKGISLEVITRVQKEGGAIDQGHIGDPSLRENTDSEVFVHVLDQMMEESRVDVLFNTFAFDAVVEDDVLKGVTIVNKSGPQVILANVVVDASGDGDIAAAAGASFEYGREKDGRCHGGSLLMEMGGIDIDRVIDYLKNRPNKTEEERKKFEEEASRILGGGGKEETTLTLEGHKGFFDMGGVKRSWEEIEQDRRKGIFLRLPGVTEEWLEFVKNGMVPPLLGAKGLVYPRSPRVGGGVIRQGKVRYDQAYSGMHEAFFNQTDGLEISKALIYMRKINRAYIKFLRQHIPGFEDAYIIRSCPMVGTRESRRIVCEYTLTEEDIANGSRFPDVISKSGRVILAHNIAGIWGEFIRIEPKKPFDYPYRCLVPKKIDNLLVAGRCISSTWLAREMNEVGPMATGEAAGAAAALSSKLGVPPRKLDIKLLQKKLLDQGVLLFLEEEKDKEKEVRAHSEIS